MVTPSGFAASGDNSKQPDSQKNQRTGFRNGACGIDADIVDALLEEELVVDLSESDLEGSSGTHEGRDVKHV